MGMVKTRDRRDNATSGQVSKFKLVINDMNDLRCLHKKTVWRILRPPDELLKYKTRNNYR